MNGHVLDLHKTTWGSINNSLDSYLKKSKLPLNQSTQFICRGRPSRSWQVYMTEPKRYISLVGLRSYMYNIHSWVSITGLKKYIPTSNISPRCVIMPLATPWMYTPSCFWNDPSASGLWRTFFPPPAEHSLIAASVACYCTCDLLHVPGKHTVVKHTVNLFLWVCKCRRSRWQRTIIYLQGIEWKQYVFAVLIRQPSLTERERATVERATDRWR